MTEMEVLSVWNCGLRTIELGAFNGLTKLIKLSVRTNEISRAFFLGGRRGTRTPKHFVNLTGESKNLKIF
jgi:hypothetical protein